MDGHRDIDLPRDLTRTPDIAGAYPRQCLSVPPLGSISVAKVDTAIHSHLELSMSTRHTLNVSITPELDRFVAMKVASGRYGSASEVVRAALRLLEEREPGVLGPGTGIVGK
jgi:antitoxin ParD1/3/4